jgi:hypothetical protein
MKKFNWQIFISFNLLFTFLFMLLSGIILYFKPEGSVARWLDWKILFIDISTWESLHTVFSFLFLVFALLHIIKIHLPNIAFYLQTKSQRTGRELYFSAIITVVFLFGTALSLQPFNLVYKAGTNLSDAWGEIDQPPEGVIGARSTLKEYSQYRGIQYKSLEDSLKAMNISSFSGSHTFQNIGEVNNLPPYKFYEILQDIDFSESARKDYTKGDITISEIAFLFDTEYKAILNYMIKHYNVSGLSGGTTINEVADSTGNSIMEIRRDLYRFHELQRAGD